MKMLTSRRHWTFESGFTLVEAVVSFGIVGVLITALYGGMTLTTFQIRMARENRRATEIMVEKMENIRVFSWDQIVDPTYVPTSFTALYYDNGSPTNAGGGITYTGTVTIAPLPTADRNYSNDLRVITITLNWNSGDMPRTRSLNTYVGRYGVQNYILN